MSQDPFPQTPESPAPSHDADAFTGPFAPPASPTPADGAAPTVDEYGRTPDRWAGSGDPEDPTAGLTDREYDIYWAGVRDSMREERFDREAATTSSPLPFTGGAGGGLTVENPSPGSPTPSPSRKREGDYADTDDALVRPWLNDFESGLRIETFRDGGWNPRRKRVFLETLADSGIVTQACRAAAISPRAAYNLRNRDAIFAEAWVAAQALARQRLADDLLERATRAFFAYPVSRTLRTSTAHRCGRQAAVPHRQPPRPPPPHPPRPTARTRRRPPPSPRLHPRQRTHPAQGPHGPLGPISRHIVSSPFSWGGGPRSGGGELRNARGISRSARLSTPSP